MWIQVFTGDLVKSIRYMKIFSINKIICSPALFDFWIWITFFVLLEFLQNIDFKLL